MSSRSDLRWLCASWCLLAFGTVAPGAEEKTQAAGKPVVGESRFLRRSPKKFATLLRAHPGRREVSLRIEGEKEAAVWKVDREAEIRVRGYWGRLHQLRQGDRIWVWFHLDRRKEPASIFMIADEISEQEIHGLPWILESVDAPAKKVTIRRAGDGPRTLDLGERLRVREAGRAFVFSPGEGEDAGPTTRCREGDTVRVQSAGEGVRLLLNEATLERVRGRQRDLLRRLWREQGLPGTVTFLHPVSGEMEVMLDHEAIRWGRYLKSRDEVELNTTQPIRARVVRVEPWRERTRVALATVGIWDQSELATGQRIQLRVPEPPAEVQDSDLPTDLGRRNSRAERLDWFLASTYCACKIGGDGCTGMFYTLAGCHPERCGMPKQFRAQVAELIDRGLDDRAVLKEIRKSRGPQALKPHLLR